MLVSEDAEPVRRRGRGLTPRIMEIYVQEVAARLSNSFQGEAKDYAGTGGLPACATPCSTGQRAQAPYQVVVRGCVFVVQLGQMGTCEHLFRRQKKVHQVNEQAS